MPRVLLLLKLDARHLQLVAPFCISCGQLSIFPGQLRTPRSREHSNLQSSRADPEPSSKRGRLLTYGLRVSASRPEVLVAITLTEQLLRHHFVIGGCKGLLRKEPHVGVGVIQLLGQHRSHTLLHDCAIQQWHQALQHLADVEPDVGHLSRCTDNTNEQGRRRTAVRTIFMQSAETSKLQTWQLHKLDCGDTCVQSVLRQSCSVCAGSIRLDSRMSVRVEQPPCPCRR